MLDSLGPLPAGAKLFTADAILMYANIDTNHAMQVIAGCLDQHHEAGRLPSDFPLAAVKETMEIIVKNNIFEWGDLYFLQLLGTAIGTSATCMWATLYYCVHKSVKSQRLWHLRWEFEEPSDSVVFLDLIISKQGPNIVTSTYRKALNLYQYISLTSAHPPGMMKGIIIFSLMKTYRRQDIQTTTT
ncbi:hypothetical protein ACHAWF_017999 [Thalassiosira exigua]